MCLFYHELEQILIVQIVSQMSPMARASGETIEAVQKLERTGWHLLQVQQLKHSSCLFVQGRHCYNDILPQRSQRTSNVVQPAALILLHKCHGTIS
jgi:hypothetical protein